MLAACHAGDSTKSLAQIKALKQEVARLQEENRVLALRLEEVRVRYGVRLDPATAERAVHGSIFDRVFADTAGHPPHN
jgi:hypothetical protein